MSDEYDDEEFDEQELDNLYDAIGAILNALTEHGFLAPDAGEEIDERHLFYSTVTNRIVEQKHVAIQQCEMMWHDCFGMAIGQLGVALN